MAEKELEKRGAGPEKFETLTTNTRYLPDLCTAGSVLSLVLVGELLALALTVVQSGLAQFDWPLFGVVSFLIQWVMLSSAAALCASSAFLNKLTAVQAFTLSYVIIIGFTLTYSLMGYVLFIGWENMSVERIAVNTLLAATFAGILLRYFYVQARLNQKEQSEAEARLIALQSRIRPHFLFNSLNSIASLIEIDPPQAEKTVINLSKLFRASLKMPRMTSISSEIELCRSFADIEQLRLGKRLTLEWRLGDLAEDAQILSLLLQPLIENAIYHGIQPFPVPGTVNVDIQQVEKDILIKVSNPYKLESWRQSEAHQSDGAGIALSNIRSRLEASYGRKAYLRVVKGETDFIVIVRYPSSMNSK